MSQTSDELVRWRLSCWYHERVSCFIDSIFRSQAHVAVQVIEARGTESEQSCSGLGEGWHRRLKYFFELTDAAETWPFAYMRVVTAQCEGDILDIVLVPDLVVANLESMSADRNWRMCGSLLFVGMETRRVTLQLCNRLSGLPNRWEWTIRMLDGENSIARGGRNYYTRVGAQGAVVVWNPKGNVETSAYGILYCFCVGADGWLAHVACVVPEKYSTLR